MTEDPRPKSFRLDGQRYRLDPTVPIGTIRWLVGQLSVGTPDEDVVEVIKARLPKDTAPRIADQCGRYALKCHRENQRLVATLRL
jgi:hypothetical protein